MGNKIITGFVITFWLVMMAALVRVEFFPRESRLLPLSTEQVLAQIVKNSEPARLDVIYQDQKIGSCRVGIAPLAEVEALEALPENSSTKPGAYLVDGSLTLNLFVFGTPSRFRLSGKLRFDAKYELKRFDLQSHVGASQFAVAGNAETKQVQLRYNTGEGLEERALNYGETGASANLIQAMGLPGLPSIPGFGGWPVGHSDQLVQQTLSRAVTRAYRDTIQINGLDQRVYLVHTRFDEGLNLWSKIWIDEEGNVLKVDTSFGLTLVSDRVDFGDHRQIVDRLHHWPRPSHDSN
jgi:hypothetical protein